MRYRVVPFIGRIKSSQSASEVSQQLEVAINEGAQQGWEFSHLSSVNIEVKPGCLAGLLGSKSEYVRYDMVIFRQP